MATSLNKILSTCVKPSQSDTTTRKMIVMKNRTCYRSMVHHLRKLGIKPVKSVQSAYTVCCHVENSYDLTPLSNHPMVARIEHDHKVRAHGKEGKLEQIADAIASQAIASRAVIHAKTRKIRRLKKKNSTSRPKPVTARRQPVSWNLLRVEAPNVWSRSRGRGIRVAILDSGIAKNPDLRVAGGFNAINRKLPATDLNGHGTHVAGIAAALDNPRGIVGVGPRIKLYAVKALNRKGEGYLSDIIEGLDWCIHNNMQVVNMSFGFQGDSELFHQMIKKAYNKGIVLVASAGNSGTTQPQLDVPAKYNETIAVAASTIDNQIADFSSRGSGVDIAAPGVNILSTYLNGGLKRLSGTSMASPHVAGCVALLLRLKPTLRPAAIKSLLQSTARPLSGYTPNDEGSGLVNVYKAATSIVGIFGHKAEQAVGREAPESTASAPVISPVQQSAGDTDKSTRLTEPIPDHRFGNGSTAYSPAKAATMPYAGAGGAQGPGATENMHNRDFTTGTHASRTKNRSSLSERPSKPDDDQAKTAIQHRRKKRPLRASNE